MWDKYSYVSVFSLKDVGSLDHCDNWRSDYGKSCSMAGPREVVNAVHTLWWNINKAREHSVCVLCKSGMDVSGFVCSLWLFAAC